MNKVQKRVMERKNLTLTDLYLNGIERKFKPYKLKIGTPVTDLSMSDLPSPRILYENNRMKNAILLPYFDGDDKTTLSRQQQFSL